MKRLTYSNPFLVLLVIVGSALFFDGRSVVSALGSNLGWVYINKHISNETVIAKELNVELNSFSQAIKVYAGNRSAWYGLGMTYAFQRNVNEAFKSWSQPVNDPVTLIDYGLHTRRRGDLDIALTHFRAADELDNSGLNEGSYLAGTICQRALASQHMLSQSNRQYCSDYLQDNGNNLIVNSSFSTGSLEGWGGEHFFLGRNKARLQIERVAASDDFIVRLNGLDEGNHFGLFQRLTLSEGDQVRFSGRFKLSGDENLAARILYISWQSEDGIVQGNHGEKRENFMKWTEFERIFTAPPNSKPAIDFYPVLFNGEGTVWFDDIQLELIGE